MPFPPNYQPGNVILANDITQAIGEHGTGVGYTSDSNAQQKAGALWGVGWGSRGYGQTSPSLTPPAPGDLITASHWQSLHQILLTMAQHHQGTPTPTTQLPPLAQLSVGQIIQAHVPPNFDFPSELITADNNRNGFASPVAALFSCTTVNSALTVTRTSDWGLGVSGITAVVDVNFPDEDQTRYFFNSGGLITINFFQPNTGNGKSLDWATVFNTRIGTISFGLNSTSWTGTWAGSPVPIGYYQLTSTPQIVFNGTNIGTFGYYAINDVTVSVNYVGSPPLIRGARGNVLRFTVNLFDESVQTYENPVLAGTSAVWGYRRAVTFLSGIAVPSFSIITNF